MTDIDALREFVRRAGFGVCVMRTEDLKGGAVTIHVDKAGVCDLQGDDDALWALALTMHAVIQGARFTPAR